MRKATPWSLVCWGAAGVALAGYAALLASTACYLGWSDAMAFLPRPRLWARVWLTLATSTVSTMGSLLVGIPVGYALARLPLRWPAAASALLDLPVMLPPAAVGAFLFGLVSSFPLRHLLDFTGLRLGHDVAGVLLVQFAVTVAFCCRLMKASFDAIDPRFEQVARSLGASLPGAVGTVTLPLAARGILASAVVVWARAAAEWEGLMLFVGGTSGRTDVLPFSVYLDWNGGLMGEVATYSLVSVGLAVGSMALMRRIGGRSRVW